MTTDELKKFFDDNFGLNPRPGMYLVDHETYANVCQSIFNNTIQDETLIYYKYRGGTLVKIALGPNNGIMFKNVELILKGDKDAPKT